MSASGHTILSCLSEEDQSRPYFVGLLGQRYGWHQEENGKDALLTKTFEIAAVNAQYPLFFSIYSVSIIGYSFPPVF